jgi:hypothetical protein
LAKHVDNWTLKKMDRLTSHGNYFKKTPFFEEDVDIALGKLILQDDVMKANGNPSIPVRSLQPAIDHVSRTTN